MFYQQKQKTQVSLKCCEEYICTSNAEVPLYQGSEDRRQAYLTIDGKYSHTNPKAIKFFDQVYQEIDDVDVAWAFFDYFLRRDVSKVTGHQSEDPPQ